MSALGLRGVPALRGSRALGFTELMMPFGQQAAGELCSLYSDRGRQGPLAAKSHDLISVLALTDLSWAFPPFSSLSLERRVASSSPTFCCIRFCFQ